ncbi:MAG: YIP1 family protein [Vicinamibacterales bacterium]
MSDTQPQTFFRRVMGAAILDAATYEDVEADAGATGQAAAVVVLVALAAGVGDWGHVFAPATVIRVVTGLVSWLVWASVVVQVGGRILPEPQTRVSWPEMLRTLGFGAAPGLLLVFAGAPAVGGFVVWVAWLWMLVAMVVAVRQALDFQGTGRAVLVCAVGVLAGLGVAFVLGSLTATVVAGL